MREDLTVGYQVAQTAHSITEYAVQKTRLFKRWHKKSGYLISLGVKDLQELNKLISVLTREGVEYVEFLEPDIGELTAVTISPSDLADHITKYLPLAGKHSGLKNKHS